MAQTFIINIDPFGKERPRQGYTRSGKKVFYTPSKTVSFETSIKWYLKYKRAICLTGPVGVALFFNFKRTRNCTNEHPIVRPDLDNLAKAILDAGNDILWKDDKNIIDLVLRKRYAEEASIQITVWEQ